jgi:FhuF 2Fe-2S C-terminal domain/Ferric iron reductase FhuF-like transporter
VLGVAGTVLGVLDDLAALGPFFAVSAHPAGSPPGAPWRPFSELTSPAAPSGPLAARIAAVRSALAARGSLPVDQVEERVAGSAVHLGLVARLVSPALGAAVLGFPLDLRPAGLSWRDELGGPLPLSAAVPSPDAGSRPPWDQRLIDETVAPLTARVAALVPVSPRVLWGNAASAVNAAAAGVARQRPDLAASAYQAAARLLARPSLRGEPHPPGPGFRRLSCCLFYRLAPGQPSAVCGDCVLGA